MKRSNRLVLLVGVFLAIVAFVGILLLVRQTPTAEPTVPTTGKVLIAKVDIPLSAKIQESDVEVQTKDLTAILPGAFSDVSQVLGKIVRTPVTAGGQITADTLTGGLSGQILDINCPKTLRCMSVIVDQVSGVGTIIKTGDYVDMIAGLTGADKFPVIQANADGTQTVVTGISNTSVKVLLQGLQVMGTLLPPIATTTGQTEQPATGTGTGSTPQTGTALNPSQQEIVVLAVDAQQAEIIKYAQMDANISLVLRSPDDFIDPLTKQPLQPLPNQTSGVILKTLVDTYGILPPEVVETVTPAKP